MQYRQRHTETNLSENIDLKLDLSLLILYTAMSSSLKVQHTSKQIVLVKQTSNVAVAAQVKQSKELH